MAKQIKCSCGAMAGIRISKGKHKVPFIDCPECGVIMGRKKAYIERLNREAVEIAEEIENKTEFDDLTALQQSDSSNHNQPVKPSIFTGWSTVI